MFFAKKHVQIATLAFQKWEQNQAAEAGAFCFFAHLGSTSKAERKIGVLNILRTELKKPGSILGSFFLEPKFYVVRFQSKPHAGVTHPVFFFRGEKKIHTVRCRKYEYVNPTSFSAPTRTISCPDKKKETLTIYFKKDT